MRMYLIMKDFINSNIYLSLDYFVQKYDVSKRTIQNDLSYLMRISPRKGFTFHNKRGSGYLLEITNDELFKDFMESLNEGIYFQVKERPAQILAYLAIQTGYISMNNIADTFQVSKTVIKHDMNDVENLAKSYHFELERKTHYGILLRYELTSFKKYLVEEYLNQNVFIQTAVNDVIEEFNDIEQKLIRQLNKEGLKINYNELLNVIEYLKIVIYIAHRQDEQKEEFIFDKNNEINDPAKPKSIAIIKMPPVLFPAIPVTFKIIPNTSITAKLVAKNKRIRIIIKFLNKIESKHCNNGEFFAKFKV